MYARPLTYITGSCQPFICLNVGINTGSAYHNQHLVRQTSDQSGFKHLVRQTSDQSGFMHLFRQMSDKSGFTHLVRRTSDQSGFKHLVRQTSDQSGFKHLVRRTSDELAIHWVIPRQLQMVWAASGHASPPGIILRLSKQSQLFTKARIALDKDEELL